MCGIAGYFNLNREPISPVVLKKMTDKITHRGPDGEGFFIDASIGLGHRRLAIIDLSPSGHQPMVSKDGNFVIAYNGEVYNFRELRIQLESLGYHFHSKTDTEVVLNSYIEWKENCLNQFNGMFAFVIWDIKNQNLFIARDRYGTKPLYYSMTKDCFVFASEQKALLAHPMIESQLDYEALLEYFTFQNIFTDKTLNINIKMFPAGSWAQITTGTQSGERVFNRFWDFNFNEEDTHLTEREYEEEFAFLFKRAVNRQLVSDVDIGSYLSGGMDSGSITSIMASQMPYMKTFTIGFDLHSASGLELGFDERSKAEQMSYLFKTEHYEMVLKAGDMERCLSDLAYHVEEPRVGQSYPNWYAAKLASKFVKVVMAGSGGDELFAGYPWRYYRAVRNTSFSDYIDKYYSYWQRLLPNNEIKRLFQPIWEEVKHVWTKDIFRGIFKNREGILNSPEDYVNHSLYFEAKTFLHGLLVIEDKISMAHSLETRVPFLDNDLVDFAQKLPVKYKLRNLNEVMRINENEPGSKTEKFYRKHNDGKMILRQAMKKLIPNEILDNEKQGFSAPDASWFKGESIEYVKRTIYNNQSPIFDYLDRKTVYDIIDEHLAGKSNRRLFIWSVLNLDKVLRVFFMEGKK